MPAHIVTHICYILMAASSLIFFIIARAARRQENPLLQRFYILQATGYLLLSTAGILTWLCPRQGAAADAGHILVLLACIVIVCNAIFFFTIPKEQRQMRSEPGRLSARFMYKFNRDVKLPQR